MCGIAGLVSPRSDRDSIGRVLERMRDGIASRGPDGSGMLLEEGVGLLNTRLAIVDLAGGDQPIWNEDKTVGCVFNGEIYNYRQLQRDIDGRGHVRSTACDTEVLVHLYEDFGPDLVHHLHGMFAFAIYDRRHGRVVIARDRLGMKPLYINSTPGKIAFASSLRSLLDTGASADPDPSAIAEYLRFYKIAEPRTAYREVRALLPGHLLVVDTATGGIEERPYFTLRTPHLAAGLSAEEAAEQAHEAFRQAVRSHLVADVEVGAFLSGGIDSSLVVAEAQAAASRPMRTFSVAFAGPEYFNEAPWAEKVAARLGTTHETIELRPAPLELLHQALDAVQQPFAVASLLPLLTLSDTAARRVKVVLTGDGGDEVAFGYPWYRWMAKGFAHRGWKPRPQLAALVRRGELAATRLGANRLRRAAKFGRGALLDGAAASDAWRYDLTDADALALLAPEHRSAVTAGASPSTRAWTDGASPVDELRRVDLAVLMRDENFAKVDRATMAHGLEARVPLLDDAVFTAMQAVPSSVHLAHPDGKALLRRWLKQTVPDLDIERPKHGFDVPIHLWLRTELRPEVDRLLLSPARPGLIDPSAANAVWTRAEAGVPGAGHTMYAMLLVEMWRERIGA